MFEEGKWPAVATTVSYQDEGSFLDRTIFGFDKQARGPTCGDLGRRNKVTEWTEITFKNGTGLFDDLRIQPHACELNKVFPACAREINQTCVVTLDDVPTQTEIMRRETEFHGKDIDRAHWQQAQCGPAASQAIHDFVDRAVAPGRYDFLESFTHGATRHQFRFTGSSRCVYRATARQLFHLGAPTVSPFAVCGGIENNDGITHTSKMEDG